MILTNKVKIIPHNKKKYYESLGYSIKDYKKEIFVNVNDLPKGSNVKIDVKCDVCGKEKILSYSKYIKNISSHNFYSCSHKCSISKNKKTNLERYGYDNPSKVDKFKQKTKETNNIKYGKDYHMMSDIGKNKIKKTILDKYGESNVNKLPFIRNKIKKTNQLKYGNDMPFGINYLKEIFNKKYGYDNPMKIDKFKQKAKETNKIRYGYDNPMFNDEIINRSILGKEQKTLNKYSNIVNIKYNTNYID